MQPPVKTRATTTDSTSKPALSKKSSANSKVSRLPSNSRPKSVLRSTSTPSDEAYHMPLSDSEEQPKRSVGAFEGGGEASGRLSDDAYDSSSESEPAPLVLKKAPPPAAQKKSGIPVPVPAPLLRNKNRDTVTISEDERELNRQLEELELHQQISQQRAKIKEKNARASSMDSASQQHQQQHQQQQQAPPPMMMKKKMPLTKSAAPTPPRKVPSSTNIAASDMHGTDEQQHHPPQQQQKSLKVSTMEEYGLQAEFPDNSPALSLTLDRGSSVNSNSASSTSSSTASAGVSKPSSGAATPTNSNGGRSQKSIVASAAAMAGASKKLNSFLGMPPQQQQQVSNSSSRASPSSSASADPYPEVDLFGNVPRVDARFMSSAASSARLVEPAASRLKPLPVANTAAATAAAANPTITAAPLAAAAVDNKLKSPQPSPAVSTNSLRPPPSSSKQLRRTVSESDGATNSVLSPASLNRVMYPYNYNNSTTSSSSSAAAAAASLAASSNALPDLFGSLPTFNRDPSVPSTPEPIPAAQSFPLSPRRSGNQSPFFQQQQQQQQKSSSAAAPLLDTSSRGPHPDTNLWENLMHHIRVVTPPWMVPVPAFPVNRMEMIKQRAQGKMPMIQKQNSKSKSKAMASPNLSAPSSAASSVVSSAANSAVNSPAPVVPSTPRVAPPPLAGCGGWDVEEVCTFLLSLGPSIEVYTAQFRRDGIDGRQMLVLDDEDLRELGVASRIHRKTILKAITEASKAAQAQERQQMQMQTPPLPPQPSPPQSSLATSTASSSASSLPPNFDSMPQGVTIIRSSSLSAITRLGSGNFGITYRAIWRDPQSRTTPQQLRDVVIKVPRTRSGADEWNELLAFLEVPAHKHVLPLIGICTDFPSHLSPGDEEHPAQPSSKKNQTCCFVTLYMARGSLKDILVSEELSEQLLGGGDLLDENMHRAPEKSGHELSIRRFTVLSNCARLLLHIAEGLRHLHSQGILHRDIATRNILVSGAGEALVSDFGLSRKVGKNGDHKDALGVHQNIGMDTEGASTGYYRLAQPEQTALPLRWMSAESLCEYVFTTASDVWSFGVCGWEILTRAQKIPYSDLSTYNQLMAKVGGGNRTLLLPAYVPPRLASLISSCWRYEAKSRPSMAEIVLELRAIVEEMEAKRREEERERSKALGETISDDDGEEERNEEIEEGEEEEEEESADEEEPSTQPRRRQPQKNADEEGAAAEGSDDEQRQEANNDDDGEEQEEEEEEPTQQQQTDEDQITEMNAGEYVLMQSSAARPASLSNLITSSPPNPTRSSLVITPSSALSSAQFPLSTPNTTTTTFGNVSSFSFQSSAAAPGGSESNSINNKVLELSSHQTKTTGTKGGTITRTTQAKQSVSKMGSMAIASMVAKSSMSPQSSPLMSKSSVPSYPVTQRPTYPASFASNQGYTPSFTSQSGYAPQQQAMMSQSGYAPQAMMSQSGYPSPSQSMMSQSGYASQPPPMMSQSGYMPSNVGDVANVNSIPNLPSFLSQAGYHPSAQVQVQQSAALHQFHSQSATMQPSSAAHAPPRMQYRESYDVLSSGSVSVTPAGQQAAMQSLSSLNDSASMSKSDLHKEQQQFAQFQQMRRQMMNSNKQQQQQQQQQVQQQQQSASRVQIQTLDDEPVLEQKVHEEEEEDSPMPGFSNEPDALASSSSSAAAARPNPADAALSLRIEQEWKQQSDQPLASQTIVLAASPEAKKAGLSPSSPPPAAAKGQATPSASPAKSVLSLLSSAALILPSNNSK